MHIYLRGLDVFKPEVVLYLFLLESHYSINKQFQGKCDLISFLPRIAYTVVGHSFTSDLYTEDVDMSLLLV